ncbi:MAG: hypothetical protein ACOYM8_13385 [Caulobacterales bacterium]
MTRAPAPSDQVIVPVDGLVAAVRAAQADRDGANDPSVLAIVHSVQSEALVRFSSRPHAHALDAYARRMGERIIPFVVDDLTLAVGMIVMGSITKGTELRIYSQASQIDLGYFSFLDGAPSYVDVPGAHAAAERVIELSGLGVVDGWLEAYLDLDRCPPTIAYAEDVGDRLRVSLPETEAARWRAQGGRAGIHILTHVGGKWGKRSIGAARVARSDPRHAGQIEIALGSEQQIELHAAAFRDDVWIHVHSGACGLLALAPGLDVGAEPQPARLRFPAVGPGGLDDARCGIAVPAGLVQPFVRRHAWFGFDDPFAWLTSLEGGAAKASPS